MAERIMPAAARRKVEHLLRGMPADWKVGAWTEKPAEGGADWIVRLVDARGQECATVVVYCSDEEISAGKVA